MVKPLLILGYAWALLVGISAGAQTLNVAGDYAGTLLSLHLRLHLQATDDHGLQGTLDSPDQGATGLTCTNVQLQERRLTFEVPRVRGRWRGRVLGDGSTLVGLWDQGSTMPLDFWRETPFELAEVPSPVDGVWLATIDAGAGKLRIQLRVKSDRAGTEYGMLHSLDQTATSLACDEMRFDGRRFSFEVPSVRGRWSGTLNDDGNELDGVWSQNGDVPLRFAKQNAESLSEGSRPPQYDVAQAALRVADLQPVLDRDLDVALKVGALAPETGGGVVVGVVQHGDRQIFAYGRAGKDSIFEIGSISKTFTGLILAQMVQAHSVQLDAPVRELLPAGTVAKPDGAEITLLDLATHSSGLPPLPSNLSPAEPRDPYADYRAADLYAFLAKGGVQRPERPAFSYSNLGFGLLGQALANHAGLTYPELLRREVTQPLGMNDTAVELSPEQARRTAVGHDAFHQAMHPWTFAALAGAGAVRSTADDMLTYLEAHLHPEKFESAPGSPDEVLPSDTLANALRLCQRPQAEAMPGLRIALAWLYAVETGRFWHNGATGGFSSFASFDPQEDYAVIVLFNHNAARPQSFADRLGEHVAERLSGKPAVSLSD